MSEPRVVRAGRVVKAGQVTAARVSDVELRRAAVAAEAERQNALAAAYAAGFDEGHARAASDVAATTAEATLRGAQALEKVAAAAERLHAEELRQMSRAVLAAALDIAEWVLRHELPGDTRSLVARLEDAATSLLPSPTTVVAVSMADADAVRAWAARRPGVEVVVDASLTPGDAAVTTDAGSVDVSVAAALRIAAESLGVDPSRSAA